MTSRGLLHGIKAAGRSVRTCGVRGFGTKTNKPRAIHFNNAGASPPARGVVNRIVQHLQREEEIGGYAAEDEVRDESAEVYRSVATLLNCHHDEIALLENATVAWTKAFYSIRFEKGDVVLTCEAEYAANYVAMLQIAQRSGVVVQVVPSAETGELDVVALEDAIVAAKGRVKCVAISHIPTNGGLVNPAEDVGAVVKRHQVPYYLLDACQSVGQIQVDVEKIGCNLLSATGRKFLRGPRGTGFLYVQRSTFLEPFPIDHYGAPVIDVGDGAAKQVTWDYRPDAIRFEFWEKSVANRLGLGVAVRVALSCGINTGEMEAAITQLSDSLRQELSRVPGVEVLDVGSRKCGIVTFSTPLPPENVKKAFHDRGIFVSFAAGVSSPIDKARRQLPDCVRASLHYFNTHLDIQEFMEALKDILAESPSPKL